MTSKNEVPGINTNVNTNADDSELSTPIERAEEEEMAEGSDLTQSPTADTSNYSTSNASSKPHLVRSMTNTANETTASSPPSTRDQNDVLSPISPAGPNTSIEQSVRLFKMFEALRQGDTAAISRALRDAETSGLQGTTVLHLAVQCAEPSVVEYVLSMAGPGSDINARDGEGNTALHVASQLGRTSVVKLLLDHQGINESQTNYHGKTALDLARNPDVYSQLQLSQSIFIDNAVKRIQELVRNADYAELEATLADEHVRSIVDVNNPELATDAATVESGGTLLHEATRARDTKLIQLLLLNGADPFRRDRRGKLAQDITKDDRTKQILKKSPAAAAAQRGIQEKAILGANGERAHGQTTESALSAKEAREMKGYLKKWTNYTTGWKLRWFVLEDGVLSYYKHQDDAGSACRGAINMKIAKLHMDPKEKVTFEIHGKSSVKYHLKANHEVEAKRWFWALNNAIQWSKDEAREEVKRQKVENEKIKEARNGQLEKQQNRQSVVDPLGNRASLTPTIASESINFDKSNSSAIGEDGTLYDASVAGDDLPPSSARMNRSQNFGDSDNDDEYNEDDSSTHNGRPVTKDAFNITAQSAKLQLDLLGSVSSALKRERQNNPGTPLSASDVENALLSYDTAVSNLRGLLLDLLKIHKDHDAYWQYRLDRESNVRRLWEESMAKVAREQEELEQQIGESEEKRKRTKRALREALEGGSVSGMASIQARSRRGTQSTLAVPAPGRKLTEALKGVEVGRDGRAVEEDTSALNSSSRRPTMAQLTNDELSDDDSDMEEEFFDAVDAGEVEVVGEIPRVASPPVTPGLAPTRGIDETTAEQPEAAGQLVTGSKEKEIAKSYKGYEDGIRKKLALDADNRPKISLWVRLAISRV